MPTILDEIVESKRAQLEPQKSSMPLSSFRDQLKPSRRDFAAALRSPSPAFILECKKASPSRGLIRADFDLNAIARVYGRFASAISVLTESEYFQGSLVNLGIVRQQVDQPLLCKDFFVDPYQVYQARQFGADAILLILAILDDATCRQLFDLARSLGMGAIVEVSNREEQQRAISLGVPVVGINNRDLRDMSIDLQTSRELSRDFGDEVLLISESGFHTNRQVRELGDCVDGFLIGSSLMQNSDLEQAVKSTIFGEHKVCGLTRNADAHAASDAGAVFGGVIFAEASPRRVEVDRVDEVFADTSLLRVGVFQDHALEQLVEITRRSRLNVIQLHGNESPSFVRQVRERFGSDYAVWKALSVEQLDSGEIDNWFSAGLDRLVIDNHSGALRGGTGQPFDWSKIPEQRQRIMVAGGIGPDNVAGAIRLGSAGLDMNSGLEDSPGIKSASKIRAVFETIRNYPGRQVASRQRVV